MVNLKTGVSRKQSTLKFLKNKHFLPPDTHTYVSGGKKCLFFGNFGMLCFLQTPVLRFALLPYYRRFLFLCVINIVLRDSPLLKPNFPCQEVIKIFSLLLT